MPESLFKRKLELSEERPIEVKRNEEGIIETKERAVETKKTEPDLCGLIKAYLVVREIAPEAAEILRQEIIKRL